MNQDLEKIPFVQMRSVTIECADDSRISRTPRTTRVDAYTKMDSSELYMPQDVRLCGVCRQWVELSDFRRRTGGGIAHECRSCHNRQRAAQTRRQRAKNRKRDFQSAIADINTAETASDLDAATTALLGLCGGVRGFAERFALQFNAARPGSQMRTSMLPAVFKLMLVRAKKADDAKSEMEAMTDEELHKIVAESLAAD